MDAADFQLFTSAVFPRPTTSVILLLDNPLPGIQSSPRHHGRIKISHQLEPVPVVIKPLQRLGRHFFSQLDTLNTGKREMNLPTQSQVSLLPLLQVTTIRRGEGKITYPSKHATLGVLLRGRLQARERPRDGPAVVERHGAAQRRADGVTAVPRPQHGRGRPAERRVRRHVIRVARRRPQQGRPGGVRDVPARGDPDRGVLDGGRGAPAEVGVSFFWLSVVRTGNGGGEIGGRGVLYLVSHEAKPALARA